MIVIPDVAKLDFVDWITPLWEIWIHLYVVDIPLDKDTTLDDLVESTAPGYEAALADNWSDSSILSRRGFTEANWIKFERLNGAPAESAFGYYATQGEFGALRWVERFADPPWPWESSANAIWVLPRFTLRGEPRKLRTGY